MRFNHLNDWLSWQESLNPAGIDLGLERVSTVLAQSGLAATFACPIITVAGTNGKGSVVAMLEAIALSAQLTVCSYTSPHLFKYNERIRINNQPLDDRVICEAFERIDQARGSEALTYFEFSTLAALDIFSRCGADLVVLEVGLGGRLDAVNVMQPSVSIITSIDIDHIDWLGDNRESIGREKAGIFRANTLAICGDANPPTSLYQVAEQVGTNLKVVTKDYNYQLQGQHWNLSSPFGDLSNLPVPSLVGKFQLGNAATAILALQSLKEDIKISSLAIKHGLEQCQLRAHFETLCTSPLVQVDVAHNPHAAVALVSQLAASAYSAQGKCYAIIGMLADKAVEQVVDILAPDVDEWCVAGLSATPRGLSEIELRKRIQNKLTNVKLQSAGTVKQACELVMKQMTKNDRVIAFGSFYTASEVIKYFENNDQL